jgi:hypothetical protein
MPPFQSNPVHSVYGCECIPLFVKLRILRLKIRFLFLEVLELNLIIAYLSLSEEYFGYGEPVANRRVIKQPMKTSRIMNRIPSVRLLFDFLSEDRVSCA